jgi:hypothetical protein
VTASIASSGDIEIVCQTDGLAVGQTARLVFRSWDAVNPPFTVRVRSPEGKTILDRVIRDLPTGKPQSSPPVTFTLPVVGDYAISIRELYGKTEGQATLKITE